jgi:large subunit ribosomal protein L17
MVTPTKGARLGSSPAHERLILANLATSLFEHGKIRTTQVRAKRVQPVAEHLVTIAKKGTLAARRQIMATIRDKSVVHALMTEIAEQFKERPGGYTRITKIENRKGDQAKMAIIELVSEPLVRKAAAAKKDATDTDAVTAAEEDAKKDADTAADDAAVKDADTADSSAPADDAVASGDDATATAETDTTDDTADKAGADAPAEPAK